MPLVSEFADDLSDVTGLAKTDPAFFRRISQGVKVLADKSGGLWDGMTGIMDIYVDDRCVTLPRDVQTPLAINLNGYVAFPRDKWFEFHFNGPGNGSDFGGAWDEVGFFPCYRELSEDSTVIAYSSTATDDNKTITIVGDDTNDQEVSETLTLNYTGPQVTTQVYKRIKRVHKDTTTQPVSLYSIGGTSGDAMKIGYYYGDETNPMYRRIRVPTNTDTITVYYRRATRKITALTDWIPINNEMAIIEAVRSVHYRMKGSSDKADQCEMTAARLLMEDESCKRINSPVGPQVLNNARNWNERLVDYC